jgi:hypothetical protein
MVLTELGILGAAIVVAYLLYKLFNNIIHLVANAVIGAVIILAAKFLFGVKIGITLYTILICAFGGIFGAGAILLLHQLGMAF